MANLLALDQASITTGYAIFKDGKYSSHGKFSFDDHDIGMRLVKIRNKVLELIRENDITEIAFEDIQYQERVMNNVQTFKTLAEVYGVIQETLTELGLKYTIVSASTWKSTLGIKGANRPEQKRNAQQYVINTYNIKPTQDECDAICIGTHMSKLAAASFDWSQGKLEQEIRFSLQVTWIGVLIQKGVYFLLDFIVKYWMQFGFSLIIAGLTVLNKYFYNLYKKEKLHQKTEEQKNFYQEIKNAITTERAITQECLDVNQQKSIECDQILEQKVSNLKEKIDTLQDGILSIQGRDFKSDCRALLRPDHEITLDEYEQIIEDHEVYNNLGGNHKGDELFDLVTHKFDAGLTHKD